MNSMFTVLYFTYAPPHSQSWEVYYVDNHGQRTYMYDMYEDYLIPCFSHRGPLNQPDIHMIVYNCKTAVDEVFPACW
jgi:hypothetical protein